MPYSNIQSVQLRSQDLVNFRNALSPRVRSLLSDSEIVFTDYIEIYPKDRIIEGQICKRLESLINKAHSTGRGLYVHSFSGVEIKFDPPSPDKSDWFVR